MDEISAAISRQDLSRQLWNAFFLLCFCYVINVAWKRRVYVNTFKHIPTFQLPSWLFTGHVIIALFHRIMKYPLPNHVYDFQLLNAIDHIVAKKGVGLVWRGPEPVVFLARPETVECILNNSQEIKKAWEYEYLHPWIGTGLLTSHDEKWRMRRKLLTSSFHFNILRDFLVIFNQQSRILVEQVLNKHTTKDFVDIVPIITKCSLDIICESILGQKMQSQTQPDKPYVTAIAAITHGIFERILNPGIWPDILHKVSESGRKFYEHVRIAHNFTHKIIADKKHAKLEIRRQSTEDVADNSRSKRKALLDLLLDEHISNDSISEEGIREEVETFTFEGHDTTAMGLSFALYMIGLHPWVQDTIHAELDSIFGDDVDRDVTHDDLRDMKYLECVIKESLRLFPSVPLFARELRNDVNFNGCVVPKGTAVVAFTYAMHRAPDVFPDPERFLPERFSPENSSGRNPFAYIPFSAGPRNCIGQRFALMEEKTVLSSVLRRFKVRSLDPRDRIHLVDDTVLRANEPLRLQVRARGQQFDFHDVYYTPSSLSHTSP